MNPFVTNVFPDGSVYKPIHGLCIYLAVSTVLVGGIFWKVNADHKRDLRLNRISVK